jgi:flagellar motor switch protein FliN
MRGKILGGGAVALLFSAEDMAKLVSLTNTGEATVKESLDDAEMSTLAEIADSTLGGGVSNLTEKFGQDVELEGNTALRLGEEGTADLIAFLEGPATLCNFQFSADPHFDGSSVMVYSQSLEDTVPPQLISAVFGDEDAGDDAGDDAPLISEGEMSDILSGFTPEDDAPASGGGGTFDGQPLPENLDVILDIELVATARLGRVEMPIKDILNLGPGSILEVGKTVDEPVELLVNNRLVARGDVVVVDEKFGLRITEIVSREERIESLR